MSTFNNSDMKVYLEINNQSVMLDVEDFDDFISLQENEEFTINYIQKLISQQLLSLDGEVFSIKRINEHGKSVVFPVNDNAAFLNNDGSWTTVETKLLLDKYENYLRLVGPLKKFKTKKSMWLQIAMDLNDILNTNKTWAQCENRYKTILKRKKKIDTNNHNTGCSRQNNEYEAEFRKIEAIDDSIKPEVLRSVTKCVTKSNEITSDKTSESSSTISEDENNLSEIAIFQKKRKLSVYETRLKIEQKKEENRERRHQEKLGVMKELIELLKNSK